MAATEREVAPSPLLRLVVRSPHGARYRAGLRFDAQSQMVQVSADVAARLRADPMLDVSDAAEA